MRIVSARWLDEQQTRVLATCEDGSVLTVPVDESNRHWREISEGTAPSTVAGTDEEGTPPIDVDDYVPDE